MDVQGLAAVVEGGNQIFVAKLLMVALQCLWVYDYFLTLGDEINYAWSGQRSWIFALFIANRYTPVVNVVWVYVTMIHYTKSLCVSTFFLYPHLLSSPRSITRQLQRHKMVADRLCNFHHNWSYSRLVVAL